MTADIRTAARAEAFNHHYSHKQVPDRYDADLLIAGFMDGAEWAHRVTPTREQIGDALEEHGYDTVLEMCDCGWDQNTADDNDYGRHLADAILALIASKLHT